MTNTAPTRPILRYHGGKWLLAKWIISHFPKHRIYTEVFGGGGSVLLRKRKAKAEVYNDKWDLVVNVFRVLRDPDLSKELEKRLELTPFSRSEFEYCSDIELYGIADPVEKARMTIFRSFGGFGSGATDPNYSTGFRASSMRSNTNPAADWMNYPKAINTFTERLKSVVIEKRDYKDVLNAFDYEDALHYLDPPYVMDTRNSNGGKVYAYEFTDDHHIEMYECAKELKGMVIVSGYNCELYQELFKDWRCIARSAFADGRSKRVECLWLNPLAAAKQKQMTMF
jgi:DNA adenine methylase